MRHYWSGAHFSFSRFAVLGLIALCVLPGAFAQLSLQTEAASPERFIAAHGRKAIAMGYASSGLEFWAYPLQMICDYELGFRSAGSTSEMNGPALLRRITYEPEAITRTYIGPDFIVSERLFVPLNEQAVLLTYTVESRHPVDIVIHFTPVLDLMWPYSLGGQSTQWSAAGSAYMLSEGTHKFSAFIGSPDVVSHDEVLNSAEPGTAGKRLAFEMKAGGNSNHSATVIVAVSDKKATNPAARMRDLLQAAPGFEAEARQHYVDLLARTVRIETPDKEVNQQLSWAQIALDQAWVCNPALGCGLVAGYGPSRGARRPQYDWFFAGDALIAVEALIHTADYDRAREALDFIAKYQDAGSGMIWHELSQSADPSDWATRYPYMFVHVDITFHYLQVMEQYVAASGDTQFLRKNWAGLRAAYQYCASLIHAQDGLPRIPLNKLGGDEQDKITDDLDLSVSWVAASEAFSRLARLSGHGPETEEASRASVKARSTAAVHYWDEQRHAWIDGYDERGRAIYRRSDDGIRLVTEHLLDEARSDSVLDQLASSDFQTDWGTRGLAAGSPQYDPSAYSRGSVSAASTAGMAAAFWQAHRPVTAFSIWNALLPWGTLDSLGHMHELLAGDFFHQQLESVPEQTWSSAALLSATVHGLLGLEWDEENHHLDFSPHLPAKWDRLMVSNVKLAGGNLTLTLRRLPTGLELQAENSGLPVQLRFSPDIPFGARLSGAELDGKSIVTRKEEHAQDTHATLQFAVPKGKSHCLVHYQGGVSVEADNVSPLPGEPSQAVRITAVHYREASLILQADVPQSATLSRIKLRTDETPSQVQGATLSPVSDGVYDLLIDPPVEKQSNGGKSAEGSYRRAEIVVLFAKRRSK